MRELTVYRRYFYDSKCYKTSVTQTPKGVQVHNTSSNPTLKRWVQPDDGRIGYNKYQNSHNNPNGTVCANAYIGKMEDGTVAVYQTLPWDKRCWLSGSGSNGNANKAGYIGFEIGCDSSSWDRDYFIDAVMTKSVNLTAYLCQEYGIDPFYPLNDSCIGVMSHHELHRAGYASDHGDIDSWLSKFGLTMDDYRNEVKKAMDEGIIVKYIDCDDAEALYKARITSTGTYLNLRSAKSISSSVIDMLNRDEIVDVLDDSDPKWWKIRHYGRIGYAMHISDDTGAVWITPLGEPPADEEPEEPVMQNTVAEAIKIGIERLSAIEKELSNLRIFLEAIKDISV